MMIKMTIMIAQKWSEQVCKSKSAPFGLFHARAIWLFALDAALQYQYTSNVLRKIDINLTTNLQQQYRLDKVSQKR